MVSLANEKVHAKVAEIHHGDVLAAAQKLLNGVGPLYLEVLVSDVSVGVAEIDASPHLASTLL